VVVERKVPEKMKSYEENLNPRNLDVALFIPVGTGLAGTEEGNKSLARTLLFLIRNQNPDRLVFFTTDLSKKTTLKYLRQFYMDEFGKNLNKISNFINIKNIDDFTEFYTKISNQIKAFSKYHIKIDYTSGTKTMTMAACVAATMYDLELLFVSGKRGSNNIIEEGSEFVKIQNMSKVTKQKTEENLKRAFNTYRFKEGFMELSSVTFDDGDDKKLKVEHLGFTLLFVIYNHWDKFDHETALELFNQGLYGQFKEFKDVLKRTNKSLKIINDEKHPQRELYVLASLINNAYRRREEGRFDDGIARLYRAMELITDIGLRKQGINPYDVDINLVESKSVKAYHNISGKLIRGHKGVLRLPGIDSRFMLLYHLSTFDKTSQIYYNNRKLYVDLIQSRNKSILAHGFDAKTEDEFDTFFEAILKLVHSLDNKMDDILEDTKFPKFKF